MDTPTEQSTRQRVLACPRCDKTVLLDATYAGRCECGWYQPARGTYLFVDDLQMLCRVRSSAIWFRVHHDIYVLDGARVWLRTLTREVVQVDPRLAFELDLGHPILPRGDLEPVLPQVDPSAVFRLQEADLNAPLVTEMEGRGDLIGYAEVLVLIDREVPRALALLPRDIHFDRQIAELLDPALREKADVARAAGAKSYGRFLMAEGMTLVDLLNLVPGWQVLVQHTSHGRLGAVRKLISRNQLEESSVSLAIAKAGGKDVIRALVETEVLGEKVANDAIAQFEKNPPPAPLRDNIVERLCRRGVVPRLALAQALWQEDGTRDLSEAMADVPASEIEAEKEVLAKKSAFRMQERLPLGRLMVELGFCSRQRVAQFLARQLQDDAPLGQLLIDALVITPEQLVVALCEQEARLESMAILEQRITPEPAKPIAEQSGEAATAATTGAKPKPKKKKPAKKLDLPQWLIPAAGAGGALLLVVVGTTLWLNGRSPSAVIGQQMYAPAPFPSSLSGAAEATMSGFVGVGANAFINVPWRDASGSLLPFPESTESAVALKKISDARMNNPGEYLQIALLLRATNNLAQAKLAVEAALGRYPESASVAVDATFLYLEMGQIRVAEDTSRKAALLGPDDPYVHLALGAVAAAEGNSYRASREFQQAQTSLPGLVVRSSGIPGGVDDMSRSESGGITIEAVLAGSASASGSVSEPVSTSSVSL